MVNILKYSPQAVNDLDNIFEYIFYELKEPVVAGNIVNGILEQHGKLKDFSGMGAVYELPDGTETVYRYLVYKDYLSFYHVNNNTVFIDRVLNGRTDYMNILFRK